MVLWGVHKSTRPVQARPLVFPIGNVNDASRVEYMTPVEGFLTPVVIYHRGTYCTSNPFLASTLVNCSIFGNNSTMFRPSSISYVPHLLQRTLHGSSSSPLPEL